MYVLHPAAVDAQHGEHLDLVLGQQRVALVHDQVARAQHALAEGLEGKALFDGSR